ncbi:MAG: hypothetical protein DIU70_003540 [Bacillota bacterium]|nr:MAG: hypothetical protein DIU70_07965 [Bacillota bacterium]
MPGRDSPRPPVSLELAFWLTALLALAYGAVFLALLLRLPPQPATLAALTVALAGAGGWALRRQGIPVRWPAVAGACALVAGAVVLSARVYDISYDGQGYHMLAIHALREGWNPLYEPRYPWSLWVTHYPKASWLTGLYFWTFHPAIDAGKATNLIAIVASGAAAHAALTRATGNRGPILALAAMGLAANPVSMAQVFTFYNDGLLGSLLLTFAGFLAYHGVAGDRLSAAGAALALILLVNTKFTAVVYGALLSAAFLGYLALWRRERLVSGLLWLGAAGLVGVLAFGYNPYVTNTLEKGHPFYPLAGPGKVDIVTGNLPQDFLDKGRWERFYLSLTGKPGNPIQPAPSERREAFWKVHPGEFRQLSVDTRVGGFGPFMHWIALGSLALGAAVLAWDRRRGLAGLAIAGVIAVTVFINPEAWWARYVPQFWWIPFVFFVSGWTARHWVPRAAALLLLALIGVNAGGSDLRLLGYQVVNSQRLEAQLDGLKAENRVIRISREGRNFISVPLRLAEKGIPFEEIPPEEACPNPELILFTSVRRCR